MNSLMVYFTPNEKKEIRVITNGQGEPYWVAKDVAEALGYEWKRSLTISHVPAEWKGAIPISSLGGIQEMLVLSEPGLYFFLARSDKPRALPFQKWIAGQVLPAIRKTGQFSLRVPKDYIEALEAHLISEKKSARIAKELASAQKQIAHDAPLLSLAKDICETENSMLIVDVAKKFAMFPPPGRRGVKGNLWDGKKVMGEGMFYTLLRQESILIKGGKEKNRPMQQHLDVNPPRFEVKAGTRPGKDGELVQTSTTYMTAVGIIWLHAYLIGIGCETRKMRAARGTVVDDSAPSAQQETTYLPVAVAAARYPY